MALDVMNALVNFLCPTSQSAMACNQFINAPHHQVLAPMGPFLYFFFFPTIFLIIFIYILSTSVLRGPTGRVMGIRILIALAVYIFIIINGWYSVMLPLAELWFLLLPALGLLYFILRHFTGGGEGGGRGGLRFGGLPRLFSFAQKTKEVKEEIKRARNDLQWAKNLLDDIMKGKAERPADNIAQTRDILDNVSRVIIKYKYSIHASTVSHLEKKRDELQRHIDKAAQKTGLEKQFKDYKHKRATAA